MPRSCSSRRSLASAAGRLLRPSPPLRLVIPTCAVWSTADAPQSATTCREFARNVFARKSIVFLLWSRGHYLYAVLTIVFVSRLAVYHVFSGRCVFVSNILQLVLSLFFSHSLSLEQSKPTLSFVLFPVSK